MAATDSLPIPRKNVAFRVTFPILDADGDLVTGAAGLDSEVSKDGGTFADCSSEATEIATNSGLYYLDLTAGEMNADCVAVIVKTSTSGAKTTPMVFYPLEDGDWRVNVVQVAGAVQTAGDVIAEIVAAALTLSSAERNAIADALLDRSSAIETGLTPRGALRLVSAAEAGKVSGAPTTAIVIRNVGDTKDRITATVDADGNRSAVTVDAT